MTNKEIFDLMTQFERSALQTMKLSTPEFSLELSKGATPVCEAAPASAAAALASAPVSTGPVIEAPLVGVYYAAPAPDEAPFVHSGDRVTKGQTLCLIEAMKMLSPVEAPCDCVITEVLKENGTLAAFGEPLFRYQPC